LRRHIIFTGWRNDIPELLQSATVSVLPSLSEGFSNTVLESMAAGLPVITTNVGGNPELITNGKTGTLVPPRDAEALARAMNALFASVDFAHRLGEAARAEVIRKFSIEATTRQTEKLYLTLIERRKIQRRRIDIV